jgi:hypothetical protein
MPMRWYRLKLKNEGLESDVDTAWRAAWTVAHDGAAPASGDALFRKNESSNALVLYFSPVERALAQTFGADLCEKPAPAGLYLIAGHIEAWATHFPESTERPSTIPHAADALESFQASVSPVAFIATNPIGLFPPTQPL